VVSSVTVQMSTGVKELDRSCLEAFQQWRFKPQSVTKVTIPITFTEAGTKY
jgi:TonB family protein